jgi:CheY-like chemotaxis protein
MGPGAHKGFIFLAEDDGDIRANFQDALEDAGYLVLPARNGHEALARMRGLSSPALAIVDLNMPEMDGRSLVAAMRADKDFASIPVLVVSSEPADPVEGASRFLRKPIALPDLLAAVRELFGAKSS